MLGCVFLLLLNYFDLLELLKLLEDLLALLSVVGHVELLALAEDLHVAVLLAVHREGARLQDLLHRRVLLGQCLHVGSFDGVEARREFLLAVDG